MIKPAKYRVVVEPTFVDNMTKGGLYLPDPVVDKEKLKTQEGILIAVGPEADLGEIFVGDKVVYGKYAGKPIRDEKNKKDYVVLNDEDILLKITDDEEVSLDD